MSNVKYRAGILTIRDENGFCELVWNQLRNQAPYLRHWPWNEKPINFPLPKNWVFV